MESSSEENNSIESDAEQIEDVIENDVIEKLLPFFKSSTFSFDCAEKKDNSQDEDFGTKKCFYLQLS
jgi:hypothetical protein